MKQSLAFPRCRLEGHRRRWLLPSFGVTDAGLFVVVVPLLLLLRQRIEYLYLGSQSGASKF